MKSRITAVVLSVILLITSAGCGSRQADDSQVGSSYSERVSIAGSEDDSEDIDASDYESSDDMKNAADKTANESNMISGEVNADAVTAENAADMESDDDDREVRVTEIISIDGRMNVNDLDLIVNYSYHIPHIDDDTVGAERINEEIADVYKKMVDDNLLMIRRNEGPDYNEIIYESFYYDNVLSLMMKTGCYYAGYIEYRVFNYDTLNGKWMENTDVFRKAGISSEDFIKAARYSAARKYDTDTLSLLSEWEDREEAVMVFNHERNNTLSGNNITEEMPVYIDDKGQLNAVYCFSSMAGSEYSYKPGAVEFKPENKERITALASCKLGDIEAVYEKGELHVEFKHSKSGDAFYKKNDIEPDKVLGKSYSVHGCFSDIKELKILNMLDRYWPYLFIITEDGLLEMVDIEYGIHREYFCVMGPVIGAVDVKSITSQESNVYSQTAVANCGNGKKLDLTDAYFMEIGYIDPYIKEKWACDEFMHVDGKGDYDVRYELSIDDIHIIYKSILQDMGIEAVYSGNFSYMGLSEEGEVYYFLGFDNEGDFIETSIALNNNIIISKESDNYEFHKILSVTELSDNGLIYDEAGRITYFDAVYDY